MECCCDLPCFTKRRLDILPKERKKLVTEQPQPSYSHDISGLDNCKKDVSPEFISQEPKPGDRLLLEQNCNDTTKLVFENDQKNLCCNTVSEQVNFLASAESFSRDEMEQEASQIWKKMYQNQHQNPSPVVFPSHVFEEEKIACSAEELCFGDNIGIVPKGVSELHDIDDYCRREWHGGTPKAEKIRQGYNKVKVTTGNGYLRVIRGDNYCAIRAALYQALCAGGKILPKWRYHSPKYLCEKMIESGHTWILNWGFGEGNIKIEDSSILDVLEDCIKELLQLLGLANDIPFDKERLTIIRDVFNRQDRYDVKLFEAVKYFMLLETLDMYNDYQSGKDVPEYFVLLFARDTSLNPESFMRNHLNMIGGTSGLDQIEMCLLASTLGVVLKVIRINHVCESDFIVEYPEAIKGATQCWLLAEDDRHYNVLAENPDTM